MKIGRIEFEIEGSDRMMAYDTDGAVDAPGGDPIFWTTCHSPEEAAAIVQAIEKLDLAKPKKPKRSRKVSPAPGAGPMAPPEGSGAGARGEVSSKKPTHPAPAKCKTEGCKFDEDVPGSGLCRNHAQKAAV